MAKGPFSLASRWPLVALSLCRADRRAESRKQSADAADAGLLMRDKVEKRYTPTRLPAVPRGGRGGKLPTVAGAVPTAPAVAVLPLWSELRAPLPWGRVTDRYVFFRSRSPYRMVCAPLFDDPSI